MTREEKADWLYRLRADLNNGVIFTPWNKKFTEALTDVLEQESCEDAVSRAAILDMMQMKMGGKELYKAVYALPSVTPTPKWIPCSERLPKKGQQVLVTQIVRGETIVYGTVFPFEKTREKYITAWMPKPEPYKAETEREELKKYDCTNCKHDGFICDECKNGSKYERQGEE